MFAFSNGFDALFLEKKCVDDFEIRVKNTLERKIVNPLRKLVICLSQCTYIVIKYGSI